MMDSSGALAKKLNCAWIMVSVDEGSTVAKWRWRRWVYSDKTGIYSNAALTGPGEKLETPATWEEAIPILTAYIRLSE